MRAKIYEYEGERLTIRQIANRVGVKTERLRDFLRYGNTLDVAIKKADKPASHRYLTVDGETKTITEWARVTGIARETIAQRVDKGYPPKLCIFNGNVLVAMKSQSDESVLPLTEAEREKAKRNIDRKLEELNGIHRYFKVRWCDRTSHSQTWRDTIVERSELMEFLDTHYLAKVVINW